MWPGRRQGTCRCTRSSTDYHLHEPPHGGRHMGDRSSYLFVTGPDQDRAWQEISRSLLYKADLSTFFQVAVRVCATPSIALATLSKGADLIPTSASPPSAFA